VGASYRENKTTGEGAGVTTTSGQDEKTVSVNANITYQILRWLAATLDYTYTNRMTDDPLARFTENRVRAALSASFY